MAKVIVINGMGGVGKSTFVTLCHSIDPNVIETSTVDFVKEIAKFCGWNGKKNEKSRKFLSALKDAMEEFNDIPNKKVDEFIQSHPNNIIFVNAREPKNIEYYVQKYKAKTILIRNPNAVPVNGNHADTEVENYHYDYYVYNCDGLDHLQEIAKNFMNILQNKA